MTKICSVSTRIGTLVALGVGLAARAWAMFETASPESEGVSSSEIVRWAGSLETKGLNPQCYAILRHGKIISSGRWGGYDLKKSQELKGLTRVLGMVAAGLEVNDGLLADDSNLDRLLGRLMVQGVDGETAGDELGRLAERSIGESPAYYMTHRMLSNNLKANGWDWGGRAGDRGEFRLGTGAWMQPDLLMRIGQVFLDGGSVFGKTYFKPEWTARHPVGLRSYDGRLLAVVPERAAVVMVFADTADDVALASSVRGLLSAFGDSALKEAPESLAALREGENREWKGKGPSAPGECPPAPNAPPTYGVRHAVLEMPPEGNVGRNSEGDMVVLKDGRLMLAWSQMVNNGTRDMDNARANLVKRYSSDGGKTWSAPEVMVAQPPDSLNVMCVNFVRLRSGDIALFYLDKKSTRDCRPVMRVSRDEGETWSEPRQIVPDDEAGYMVLNNARVHQMSDGRLVVPVSIAFSKSIPYAVSEGWRCGGGIIAYLSDDEGRTWKRSTQTICPRDARGYVVRTEEPGVVELKDGRYLVYFRTNDDYQYFAWSSDRGVTWTKARRSTMRSPVAPATIERLSDGRLYAVWNDHSRDPGFRFRFPYHNGGRCPVTLGVSEDEGLTWRPLLDIEREGYFCYFFMREHAGFVYVGYCCEIGMKTQRVVKIPMADIEALRTSSGPLGHRIPLAPDCAIANILFARSRVDRD